MKICFVGDDPKIIGGLSLFQENLINYIKKNHPKIRITWVHRSDKNGEKTEDGIRYFGIKLPKIFLLKDILFNIRVKKYFERNYFDVINSHAIWGYWMKGYKKKKGQRIVNTYHGLAVPFYKNHFSRFSPVKKIFYSPILLFSYLIEKPPLKASDKIICVSEKVRRQIWEVYGEKRNQVVIRTGVDLNNFKPRNKKKIKKILNLEGGKLYGLYVGRGGFWTKGLDRAVGLSKEIYKKDKNFRLIVIGPDYQKTKRLLKEDFIIFFRGIPRNKIPLYYSASDLFFCMSRYEGGAPTLVVSEAMASGCLLICSESSKQEIVRDNRNGLIVKKFDGDDAEKVLSVQKNKRMRNNIIKQSMKDIGALSLDKWGKKYLEVLIGKKM